MKGIALGTIIILLLVSCSSTGRIGSESASPAGAVALSNGGDPSKSVKAPAGSTKKVKKKTRTILPDEDDNFSSLLQHDDFKDFDLPIVFNDAVKYYIVYFTSEKRKVFGNWLKRSRRYVPMIREILKQHGLPEDLVYVAMIESGFNARAYSSAKACGPWQFIYETGGRYGLKVNFWVDERRDPEKSTIAAAKYLTDLFNQFGCWYLAAAGYNAGEKRVERAIEKHNTNDFWELSKYNALPRETREYIPKLIAASIIAKDPERFGFGNISYDEPLRFVEVKVPRASSVAAIARASSMDLAEIRSLNPELLRGITPPTTDDYRIKLRYTTNVARFSDELEEELGRERKVKDVTAYKVKKKDTLAKIMKRYGVKEEEIYLVNSCDDRLTVKPGMTLNIPTFGGSRHYDDVRVASFIPTPTPPRKEQTETRRVEKSAPEKEPDRPRKQEKAKERHEQTPPKTYHIVKKGETLSEISSQYGVDMASIISINNLKSETVYPNMKLMLAAHYTPKKKGGTGAVKYHLVKKGETLSQISGKYGVSTAAIKSANNLKTGKVSAGMKLKIVSAEG